MNAHARAGISLDGSVLRYAEVEHGVGRQRLLRLGACEFGFDLLDSLRHGDEAALDTLAQALGDVFAGSLAPELNVALPASGLTHWTAPFRHDAQREERDSRLRREAALLTSEDALADLTLQTEALYEETLADGDVLEWVHVTALPRLWQERLDQATRFMAVPGARVRLRTQGAALTLGDFEAQHRGVDTALSLAIGLYEGQAEYVLCRGGRLCLSTTSTAPNTSDHGFTALRLVRQLGHSVQDVARVYLYGTHFSPEATRSLKDVFGRTPERLNPMRVVELDEATPTDGFDVEAYAPCVGVAL